MTRLFSVLGLIALSLVLAMPETSTAQQIFARNRCCQPAVQQDCCRPGFISRIRNRLQDRCGCDPCRKYCGVCDELCQLGQAAGMRLICCQLDPNTGMYHVVYANGTSLRCTKLPSGTFYCVDGPPPAFPGGSQSCEDRCDARFSPGTTCSDICYGQCVTRPPEVSDCTFDPVTKCYNVTYSDSTYKECCITYNGPFKQITCTTQPPPP